MAGLRERKKQETRQAIMEASLRLFGSRGYDRTSIEDIAREAGIGKGTIYSYFSAKHEIFLAFCDEEVESSFAHLRDSVDPDAPLLKQLVTLFMTQFLFVTENREFGRHMLRELVFPKEPSSTTLEHDRRYLNMLEEVLAAAREKGQIRESALLETASASFYMLYLGCLSGWYAGFYTSLQEVQESMERLFRQALEGVGT